MTKHIAKVLVLALGITVLAGAHCNPKKDLKDIVDCTAAQLQGKLPDLAAQAIAAALSQNWMAELGVLAKAVGPALACIEAEIIEALAAQPASAPAKMATLRAAVKAKVPATANNQELAKRLRQHFDTRYWAK